jgi:pyridinium-3,5-bisthiocarboxylic acid mononucleotide nickel chelatase
MLSRGVCLAFAGENRYFVRAKSMLQSPIVALPELSSSDAVKNRLFMLKLAYLDCSSGISGDMLLAALIDAGAGLDEINAGIASLGLPQCRLTIEETRRQGFRALKAHVNCPAEETHRHLHDILAMIDAGQFPPWAKETAKKIFQRLAEAEAKVHGTSVEKVHFHEVGATDSIVDIVGIAVGLELLGVERLIASPISTGSGKITIAHGECGIPAPATAELLKGIPLADSNVTGELTTPTGAAILAVLAESFGPPPAMTIRAIGYGAGSHDWPGQPNILRLMLGSKRGQVPKRGQGHFVCEEFQLANPLARQNAPVPFLSEESQSINPLAGQNAHVPFLNLFDHVCQLETTLDDIPGEVLGYCIECLWRAGALEVYTTAIGMKKNRPGVLLTVLCDTADTEIMEEILFRETTTLGIRQTVVARRVLDREPHTVETPWGPIAGKIGRLAEGVPRFAPEYESCRQAAEKHARPLREIYEAAQRAFESEQSKK